MSDPVRVLYVDDYPLDRELVRDALEKHGGFSLIEAASHQEFEARLAEGHYDLVLSDFNILGFEGLDVMDAVQAKDPRVPVIIVTGTGSEEIAVAAMKRGVADYVIKSPEHIRRLPRTIESVLEKRRLEEERKQAEDALRQSYREILRRQEAVLSLAEDLQKEVVERRRAEEEVRESERRLSLAQRTAHIGSWEYELETGGLIWSDETYRLYGLEPQACEATFALAFDPIHPDDKERVRQAFEAAGNHGIPYDIEYRITRPDGQERVIRGIARVARDEEGQVARLYGTGQDITERKRAEEEIKQRNIELATLLDVSQQLARRLDLDELLDAVAHSIVDKLPVAETASLWLYDEQRDRLVVRAWTDFDDGVMSELTLSPESGMAGLVYHSRQPCVFGDVASHPAYLPVGPSNAERPHSAMGAPLLFEGRPIGALFADNFSRVQAFDEQHLRLLQSLGNQAAIAIQNARLFEQVRDSRERLQALSHRLVMVQEEERHHVARELHDQVGQLLTGLNLSLDMSSDLPPEALRASIGEARALVNELMSQVRNLSLDLRPAMLDDLGLLAALLWHFRRYTDQTGVQVRFKHIGLEGERFTAELETAAYRIVQEALTNVARYAGVDEVMVHLRADEDVLGILVEDQGAGFDAEAALAAGASVGLAGMNERATLLGGQLMVDSTPGSGTCVRVELPLGDRLERRGKDRPT